MSHLTLTTMTNFIKYLTRFLTPLFVAFALSSLAACDGPTKTIILPAPPTQQGEGGNAGANHQNPTEDQFTVSYDPPDGWKMIGGHAVSKKTLENGSVQTSDLEFLGYLEGADEEAKEAIQKSYQEDLDHCKVPDCDPSKMDSQFKTLKLDMGNAFVHETAAIGPGNNRGNYLAFSKEGTVYRFALYGDSAEAYTKELEQIIKSIKLVKSN